MDEAVVRGLLLGVVLGLMGFAANMVWKLTRSTSEGARRMKIVGGLALVLIVGSVMVAATGPVGAIGTGIAIAAIFWVFKGFKKNNPAPSKKTGTALPKNNWTAEDTTEFTEVKETKPQQKTVISCPNCSGRLRVVAGRYIDVTCPHCKTVFRTHT